MLTVAASAWRSLAASAMIERAAIGSARLREIFRARQQRALDDRAVRQQP